MRALRRERQGGVATGLLPNRVKVWTLQNGSWVLSQTIEGPSYTYTAGTSPATVKIEFARATPLILILR